MWRRIRFILNVRQFLPFLWEFFTSASVPVRTKLVSLLLVLVYFWLPFDAVPDFLVLFGIVDDAAVLTFILQRIVKLAPPDMKRKYGFAE